MYLKLRILFTVLAALCLVAILPAGTWGGLVWFGIFGGGALLFFALMLVCKQAQEKAEEAKNPKEEEADFLHPANKEKK